MNSKPTRTFIRRAIEVLGLAIILCVYTSTAFSQSGSTGTLSGTVKDPNDASLMGVSIKARNVTTDASRSVVTNSEGRWTIPGLAVGNYQITYELEGFKTLIREGISVEASVPRTLEDKLEIGEVGAIVNVVGGSELVASETATTFRQLSSEDLVSVPTSTRSFTQLLSTEAGVNTDLSPVLTNGNGNQSPSVNGTRTTSTSLFFNGVDATNITTNEGSLNDNIAPAPETLQEVKLQTSLYDASTGRSGGGNFQLDYQTGRQQFSRFSLLLPAEREVQRQRLFLQQGRNRPAQSAPERSRLHARWSNREGQVLCIRQLSVHRRDYRFCANCAEYNCSAVGAETNQWCAYARKPGCGVQCRERMYGIELPVCC